MLYLHSQISKQHAILIESKNSEGKEVQNKQTNHPLQKLKVVPQWYDFCFKPNINI